MRITAKSLYHSFIFIACIIITFALAGGLSAADASETSGYSLDYSYSSLFSRFTSLYNSQLAYAGVGSQERLQKEAAAYYRDWQADAADLGLNFTAAELDDLADYLRQGPEAYMLALTAWTNEQIELAVQAAQLSPEDDIKLLKQQEALLVKNLKYWSRVIGLGVACQYTDYAVDGEWVSIDPLRVV